MVSSSSADWRPHIRGLINVMMRDIVLTESTHIPGARRRSRRSAGPPAIVLQSCQLRGRSKLTSATFAAQRTQGSPLLGTQVAAALSVALATAPTSVLAEARVLGSQAAVTIEAQDSSIEEILTALSNKLGIRYRSTASLERRLSGAYVGPLPRVLKRVLDGYNFVVKTEGGTTTIAVFGALNAPTTARASFPSDVDLARPLPSASTAAPLPPIESAEPHPFPSAALPANGGAPAPVPELRQSAMPAPTPLASSSTGTLPLPGPEPSKATPPVGSTTPRSAPQ